MSGIEDLYVFQGGKVRLGSEARLGRVSQVREVALRSLHVQDGGTFEVDSGHHSNDVVIMAETVKVRFVCFVGEGMICLVWGSFEVDSGHHSNDVIIMAETVKVRFVCFVGEDMVCLVW